jgi:hypothetical protein
MKNQHGVNQSKARVEMKVRKKYDTGRDKRDGHYSRHNHRKCKIATQNRSTVRACDFIGACGDKTVLRTCDPSTWHGRMAAPQKKNFEIYILLINIWRCHVFVSPHNLFL